MPFGKPLLVSSKDKGDLEITVTGLVSNANAKMADYNMFNSDPKEGEKWILANVSIKNLTKGSEVTKVSSGSFGLVGSSGKMISAPFAAVVKSPIDAELYEGGTTKGEIPFLIPTDEKNLLLIYDAASFGGSRYYFALQ